jgi:hypothetical protein
MRNNRKEETITIPGKEEHRAMSVSLQVNPTYLRLANVVFTTHSTIVTTFDSLFYLYYYLV